MDFLILSIPTQRFRIDFLSPQLAETTIHSRPIISFMYFMYFLLIRQMYFHALSQIYFFFSGLMSHSGYLDKIKTRTRYGASKDIHSFRMKQ